MSRVRFELGTSKIYVLGRYQYSSLFGKCVINTNFFCQMVIMMITIITLSHCYLVAEICLEMYSSSLLNGHALCSSWWMVCGWSMLKMKLANNCFMRSSKEVALVITTTGPDSVTCSYLENVFHTLCTCPFSSYTIGIQELNAGSYLVSFMIKALYSKLLLCILKTCRQKLENSYADIHYVTIFYRVMYHASGISSCWLL
jgi:hypothetical protein